jgi:hypothetical membrane protein
MSTGPRVSKLLIAGIIAPIWFTTLVIIQGVMQPDYDHVTMPISALAAWPAGWLQRINFYGIALLMALFAIGVHRSVRPTRFGLTGIGLLLASALGLLLSGLFSWISVDGVPTETKPHVAAAVLVFVGASTGFIALSRRMSADPHWRSLAPYVLATGILMLVFFIAVGALGIPDGTPLHPWVGLLQRVLILFWFACMAIIASRALRSRSSVGVATVAPIH